MKTIKLIGISLAAFLALAPILQSCDWDNNDNEANNMALVTVKVNTDKTIWGLTDNNEKIFFNPSSSIISSYKATEGQRAIIYFNPLSEKVSGYDYNADVRGIQDILTKDIKKVTTAAQDTLGDDAVNIVKAWIGGGYLNIQLNFYTNGKVTHLINVEDNQLNQSAEEIDGKYVNLELRHNKNNDPYDNSILATAYVCFKLGDYNPALLNKEGINLRYSPLDGGPHLYKKATTNSISDKDY